ncbi:ABC transporter substrate-binding protein [Pseudonocardia sp. GCM10023141]|uniref:ABC transporter substrate-binding protein n=1 Tax=Pseudonocardia sp. GCM10023141 TaxID=3252653 RepID=UPI0036241171
MSAVTAVVLAACGNTGASTAAPSADAGARNGTADGAVRGGTLNLLGSGDVDYMDPNVSYYSPSYLALRLWSRQLFTYPADPANNTKAVPDLAEAVPTADNGGISADGKTYTISIRQGAQWGTTPARQVTAADEVRGVKRTCNPVQPFGGLPDYQDLIVGFQQFCDGFKKVGQDAASIKNYVENTPLPGVTAKDDHTVVFTLNHPAAYLVDMLTLTAFSPAPVEVLDHLPGSSDLGTHQVSDGPYKIDLYDPTKRIEFSRNPAWNAASDPIRQAFVDKVVIDETVSQESTQQQLQTGNANADMEFDNFVPAAQIPGLQAAADPNLNLGDTASSNPYIVYNTRSPNNNSALGNVKVRQAISYAINRADIIQVLGGPEVSPPLTHVLPPQIVGSKDSDPYPYDPAKAKQMLADAGFPNGITLKLLYRNASAGSSKAFATVQQDLTKAGITVQGVPSPNADFYTKYLQVPDVATRGVYDMAIAGWGADWYGNAALSFFNPLFSGAPSFPPVGSNFGYYDSQATNALITQAIDAPDAATASDAWAKADAQVMADAAFFPITAPRQPNYHAAQVHNAVYIPSFQGFDPSNVWLDKDKQGG